MGVLRKARTEREGSKIKGRRNNAIKAPKKFKITKFCTWMIDVLVGMALAFGGVGIVVDHYWRGQ